jgi:hypothetical protein
MIVEMNENELVEQNGKAFLDHSVPKGTDPSEVIMTCDSDDTITSAFTATQIISCNCLLDRAMSIGSTFENHARHVGLPTQVNWLMSH